MKYLPYVFAAAMTAALPTISASQTASNTTGSNGQRIVYSSSQSPASLYQAAMQAIQKKEFNKGEDLLLSVVTHPFTKKVQKMQPGSKQDSGLTINLTDTK